MADWNEPLNRRKHMGVFEDRGSYLAGETAPKQQCKRDYESDIKALRTGKQVAEDFRDAIYKYVSHAGGSRSGTFTLAELIGRLELDIRDTDRVIDRLIAEQEREKS